MPCGTFEDRLLEYADLPDQERAAVDAHVAGCAACRIYLETLAHIDRELEHVFASAVAPVGLAAAVLRRARAPEPSMVPELLDAIGWIGVFALLACLVFFVPGLSIMWALAAVSVFVCLGVWMSVRAVTSPY